MANEEHLAQLKRGVEAWNDWRDENPGIQLDLRGADLRRVDLCGTHLRGAILDETILRRANLTGADLRGADLPGARMEGTTLGDLDLSTVRGLEMIQHEGPSTIGINTLYRSKGNIPEDMITYSKSLVGRPFEFYSCFISYSSRDEALAQRLHADLQDKGVRCWFAPEDLKNGGRVSVSYQ
jgi:hypothetical protein